MLRNSETVFYFTLMQLILYNRMFSGYLFIEGNFYQLTVGSSNGVTSSGGTQGVILTPSMASAMSNLTISGASSNSSSNVSYMYHGCSKCIYTGTLTNGIPFAFCTCQFLEWFDQYWILTKFKTNLKIHVWIICWHLTTLKLINGVQKMAAC